MRSVAVVIEAIRGRVPVSLSPRAWADLKGRRQKPNRTEESNRKHESALPSESGPHRARSETSCDRLRAPGHGRSTHGCADPNRAGRPARSATHPCTRDTPARQDSTGADGTDRQTTPTLDDSEMVTATGPLVKAVAGPKPEVVAALDRGGRRE